MDELENFLKKPIEFKMKETVLTVSDEGKDVFESETRTVSKHICFAIVALIVISVFYWCIHARF